MTALDHRDPVDVIFLDFKKAFDSVLHQRFINKFDAYGIAGKIKEWLTDFLIGRNRGWSYPEVNN